MPESSTTINLMSSISRLFIFMVAATLIFSCKTNQKITEQSIYFRNISDSMLQKQALAFEPVLQRGDILSIVVVTPNEASSKLFNRPNTSETSVRNDGSAGGGSGGGYLIDENGNISIPYVGYIKAAGLTRMQLTDTLTNQLRRFIDSANVTVRLTNYRITILGEVAKPGTFTIPNERVTILDALGLAGDLTIFGKRNNIRVIRETDEGRQTGTIDINKGDIFNSPFYYLRQNDVVYVEMNNRKVINSDQSGLRTFGVIIGAVSAIGVIVSTINVLSN
jgi:polysaccharide biosynthesis/export protein